MTERNEKGQFVKGSIPHNIIGTKRTCMTCGKTFSIRGKNRRNNGKFCSYDCYWSYKKGKTFFSSGLSGTSNGNWKGGLPHCERCDKTLSSYKPKTNLCMSCRHENSVYKNGGQYKTWARLVKERDNFTCQICGKSGVWLESDHIKSWALYPELRFDLANGRTLCKDCHQKTDNYAGRVFFN
jgi:hypothetical protein